MNVSVSFKLMLLLTFDHLHTNSCGQFSLVSWIVYGVSLWCRAIVCAVSGLLINADLLVYKMYSLFQKIIPNWN
jgi:hypothetical protein